MSANPSNLSTSMISKSAPIILALILTFAPAAPLAAKTPGQTPGQTPSKPQSPLPTDTKSSTNPTKDPERGAGSPAKSDRSNVLVTGEEDYRIGAGDTIDIRVADAEELSGTFRVRADGTIKMHFLGRLLVLNKTTDDLAKEIADGLRGKYLFEPRVSVDVTELTSRSIYIQGAVNKPGVYQIDGRANLLQLLVMAGGLVPNHSTTAFIIRRIKVADDDDVKARSAALKIENQEAKRKEKAGEKPGEAAAQTEGGDAPHLQDSEWLSKQYTLLKLNINGLFKGKFDQNMLLEPGDIINIPMTEQFYVSGQVKAPGSFPLKESTTLRQALSLAQGFTPTANAKKGIIFRENPETGTRMDIQVDMSAVMDGKAKDVTLYANDVVVIPDSTFKVWTLPLIQSAASSILTAILFRAISF